MAALIFWIIVTLILSGFFSGSEMAFVSANKLGIEVLRNKGKNRGKFLSYFYDKPKKFLGTMLVGNNIALVVFTILMTSLIEPYLNPLTGAGSIPTLLIVTLIITIVVLIFGEYIPKTIFRLYANEFLYKLSYPLMFFQKILAIPTSVMIGMSNFLLKNIFGAPVEESDQVFTRIDLEHYINESIGEEESIDKEILTNALNLNQVRVRDCMVPRNDIISIDKESSRDDLKEVFIESRLSRIMVTEDDKENIIGYIHHQKLLEEGNKTLAPMVMPITYIPEAMNVQTLMQKFISENTSIAVVVDEYGSISGLITLEDILEEIFGEIEDEHDDEGLIDEQINEREFRFSGKMELSNINETYDAINIPEGEYHTLSGYIVMTSQSIPDAGEEIVIDDTRYIIEKMENNRIETVRVILPDEEQPEE